VLGKYTEVLRTPGALAFSASGLVARLPMSMFGLSIVLAITELGGSYGRAGVLAGLALVAHAIGSPVQARIADRIGQQRMLVPVLAIHTLGLAVLIIILPDAAVGATSTTVLMAVVLITGLTMPQVGALSTYSNGHTKLVKLPPGCRCRVCRAHGSHTYRRCRRSVLALPTTAQCCCLRFLATTMSMS
jgi:MFS family permease